MKTLFTLGLLFVISFLRAKHQVLTLEKASKTHIIKFKIKGTGIYKGDCLKLSLDNNIKDSLIILLEPGHRLDSKNNDEQDILVLKEQFFVLGGYQHKEFKVNGFCCQASNHSPRKDSAFKLGAKADANLVSLAQYCNQHTYFREGDLQNAVWCVSDKRPIASISEGNEELRKFVSKITKCEIPWYQIEYEKANSYSEISDRVERISGNVNYDITKTDVFRIELRDAKGHLLQNYTDKKPSEIGNHDYWFDMQVSHYPKGEYYIHFYNGKELVTKKQFVL